VEHYVQNLVLSLGLDTVGDFKSIEQFSVSPEHDPEYTLWDEQVSDLTTSTN
jgi:hypothetical protein